MKILVVDDDESILEAIELTLTIAGYDVETSTKDGEFINQRMTKDLPNLIILDVLLSGSDGRTICKNLKNNEKTKHIPIIMTSAHPDAKSTVFEVGANEFLAKPFDINDLLKMVKKYYILTK